MEVTSSFIQEYIENLVENSTENRLFFIDNSPIFTAPLVGFADGDNPLLYLYKERIIGPFYMTPREVLGTIQSPSGGGNISNTKEISVICWVLPYSKRIRASNMSRHTRPSLRWSHGNNYGELFNESIKRELVSMLTQRGYLAVAPTISPLWMELHNYPGGPVSNWSDRHALYVAGLGTFGLSDNLITSYGVAVQCGSIVVNLHLPPTPRPYKTHTEYCRFHTDRASCGFCIDRCPVGAITINGHNRSLCVNNMHDNTHLSIKYGVEHSGCALCQTGVPCETIIPSKASHDPIT